MARLKFRPSLREQRAGVARHLQFMAGAAPADKREAAQEMADAASAMVKPRRERAAPRDLEGPVVKAISELLAVHPRVIWAGRFNSGAAGEFGHIWFHKFVRMPEPMRMPDFFGLCKNSELLISCGIPNSLIAIEAKSPLWTKPRDDREREQAAFLRMIRDAGGIGLFATSADDVAEALK